ncbi:Transcription elongation factor SPT5 [Zalerion maritima]|uniref:Transcription elongation factor SPT5 n=1 Tax=Zalerion maritima TaxID=339359 RepID=A0AAD5RNX0_9PEZI|nr:Transcription elongation factor SPT5 [Zalerion maritima]
MSAHDQFHDSDEEEEEFNPPPATASDDEGAGQSLEQRRRPRPEDEEDDEEDHEQEQADHDDDEDEEEDEDDEDDVHGGSRPRKRRKAAGNAFIDLEAEVDDEDEAEDDEADGEEIRDFIDHSHPDDVAETERMHDDRHHRELDRRMQLEAGVDAEEQAELYKIRYGRKHRKRGLGDGNVMPRRLLLPSVDDPSIWAVKCKEGKEREVIFSIMKRVEESQGTNREVSITSAFERGGPDSVMKGLIYVEAQRLNDIILALDGMLNVYVHGKNHMVDIKEMPDLLRIQKTEPLQPGAWVRLRRPPKHNGDLAQVIDVTENGLEARVRFIPRIDYGGTSNNTTNSMFGKRKRPAFGHGPRPPQRFFNETDAKKHDPRGIVRQGNSWLYRGDEFENGFQVKDIKIQLLQTQHVEPSLEEVTKFANNGEDGNENLDLGALAASLKEGSHSILYVPGDTVEVYDGEQKGVVGKATHVTGDIVTLQVTEGGLQGQSIEVPTRWLRKKFNVGDHVKVVGGSRFRDEAGMVVKISEDRVTILSDQNSKEITVFSKDLREASDSGGQSSLGQYSLLDLVQVDSTTVGCVVKVDRESLGVLDQNADVRTMQVSQIANRLPKRKLAVAADRNGSEIRLEDVVKEHGGQQRQGKIIHIHRSFVYLHSNDNKENAGVFVVRANNVATVAAKGGRITGQSASSGPDLNAMNPAVQRLNHPKQMAPPKIIGRDKSIGQTVHVKKGGYKGLLGVVKDATDTHVRLELHSKNKIITVPKDTVIFKDKITGERIDITRRGPPQRSGGLAPPSVDRSWQGGRTPSGSRDSGRTPGWGSATPSYGGSGGRTPAWSRGGDGGRTPAWQDGSRTVNPYADGSRTAYGGGGGRTPAWSSGGGKTPAGDFGSGSKTPAYGGGDSWNSGSKTPAYGASAPTPGASGGPDWGAPTPGALNAPTPGAYSAPTPAAVNAPTPGAWQSSSWGGGGDSAPTPAAGAPTPAAGGMYYGAPTPAPYTAETPAASGPRYDD